MELAELKPRILKLLKEDEEFRYAVARLASEHLKKLSERPKLSEDVVNLAFSFKNRVQDPCNEVG